MRLSIVLILTVFGCAALAADFEDFDMSKLTRIMNDKKLVKSLLECIVDDKDCTREKTRLKNMLINTLKKSDSGQNPKQKILGKKVFQFFREKYPEKYNKFLETQDPKGIHRGKFEKFLGGKKKKQF